MIDMHFWTAQRTDSERAEAAARIWAEDAAEDRIEEETQRLRKLIAAGEYTDDEAVEELFWETGIYEDEGIKLLKGE